eukprot:Nk52_evm7s1129 gene=Nk52_evmTU7s1129
MTVNQIATISLPTFYVRDLSSRDVECPEDGVDEDDRVIVYFPKETPVNEQSLLIGALETSKDFFQLLPCPENASFEKEKKNDLLPAFWSCRRMNILYAEVEQCAFVLIDSFECTFEDMARRVRDIVNGMKFLFPSLSFQLLKDNPSKKTLHFDSVLGFFHTMIYKPIVAKDHHCPKKCEEGNPSTLTLVHQLAENIADGFSQVNDVLGVCIIDDNEVITSTLRKKYSLWIATRVVSLRESSGENPVSQGNIEDGSFCLPVWVESMDEGKEFKEYSTNCFLIIKSSGYLSACVLCKSAKGELPGAFLKITSFLDSSLWRLKLGRAVL